MAPDEAPATNVRDGSVAYLCWTYLTIEVMPTGSLLPLWVSAPAEETSQQLPVRTVDG